MGQLFYIIGASGVGKDSLINYSRRKINGTKSVVFAHRYITRPADSGGENHVELSMEEFRIRKEKGFFSLYWGSHQNWYGIGAEIDLWLSNHFNVVVNGSREYLVDAQTKYRNLVPVLITATPETLRKRLLERNRETTDEIEKRIQRSQEISFNPQNLITIHNDGSIEQAGELFISTIAKGYIN
jgi:ribose 1,5-bisphosphokinase